MLSVQQFLASYGQYFYQIRRRHRRHARRRPARLPKFSTTSRPFVKAGRHHRRAGPPLPRIHGERARHDPRAAELLPARLHALSEIDLHLGQRRGLPRHPRRQGAEERRHRQHRRHRHQGRLSRRHQPHVLRRRAVDPGASACAKSPTNACGSAFRRSSPARIWATSAT